MNAKEHYTGLKCPSCGVELVCNKNMNTDLTCFNAWYIGSKIQLMVGPNTKCCFCKIAYDLDDRYKIKNKQKFVKRIKEDWDNLVIESKLMEF